MPLTEIHRFATLPSTQEEAHRLAAGGVPHGTAVVAGVQTAGRGTRGRRWVSPPGGLWMSVVCRPDSSATAAVASLRAGLAVAETLEREVQGLGRVALKWPNDLLLQGRKLAGLLCEARWQGDTPGWLVVGVGINVTNALPAEVQGSAIAIAQVAAVAGPDAVAEPVRAAIAAAVRQGGELTEPERERFVARNLLQGRTLSAPVRGIVSGVGPNGALLVQEASGVVAEVLDAQVEAGDG